MVGERPFVHGMGLQAELRRSVLRVSGEPIHLDEPAPLGIGEGYGVTRPVLRPVFGGQFEVGRWSPATSWMLSATSHSMPKVRPLTWGHESSGKSASTHQTATSLPRVEVGFRSATFSAQSFEYGHSKFGPHATPDAPAGSTPRVYSKLLSVCRTKTPFSLTSWARDRSVVSPSASRKRPSETMSQRVDDGRDRATDRKVDRGSDVANTRESSNPICSPQEVPGEGETPNPSFRNRNGSGRRCANARTG